MRLRSSGFTLVELLAVIAIISVLILVIGFTTNKALGHSRQAKCLGNTRSIAVSIKLYASDHGNKLPFGHNYTTGRKWYQSLKEYGGTDEVLKCPSNNEDAVGYGWNYPALPYRSDSASSMQKQNVNHWRHPGKLMLVGCWEKTTGAAEGYVYSPFPSQGQSSKWAEDGSMMGAIGRYHGDGANFAFLDGHCEWRTFDAIRPTAAGSEYFWGLKND